MLIQESPCLIWVDTRPNHNYQSLTQDLYFGIHHLRLSVRRNSFWLATEFFCGDYIFASADEVFNLLNHFLRKFSSRQLIIRITAEWTVNITQCNAIILMSIKWSWIRFCFITPCGDTHHGVKPLQSVIDAESVLNPDIISCNQIHHMHFSRPNI